MRDALVLGGSLLAGGLLGAVFFGGLWLTVRALPRFRRPGLVLPVAYLARFLVVGFGLWLIMAGDPRRLLAALAGMLAVRALLVARVRSGLSPREARTGAEGGGA